MSVLQRAWKRTEPWFAILGYAMGVVALISLLSQWWQPTSELRVIWAQQTRDVLSPTANFLDSFSIDGEQAPLGTVKEAVVTIWRTNGIPIGSDDVRSPLVFSPSADSRIITFRAVAADSVVEPNFNSELKDGSVHITWKTFDPGMAIKFAVLVDGLDGRLHPASSVGPNIEVAENGLSFLQGITLFAITIAVGGIIPVALIEWWTGKRRARGEKNILPAGHYAVGALFYVPSALAFLFFIVKMIQPAVPLALASVSGL